MTPQRSVKLLALGDSYTIGESVLPEERWPAQLLNILEARGYACPAPEIIAKTGWRTDELKRAIESRNDLATDFDIVSLLIGVNNQYQGRPVDEYEQEFADLLNMAVLHAGGNRSKVLVLSIPDYGFTPFGKASQQRISREIDAFNKANRALALAFKALYIDVTEISRKGLDQPDLVAGDGLHPSGKMYRLWAEKIAGELNN